MPLAALPPELWAIILDSIIKDSVNPAKHCDHMNFPQIDYQMREPHRPPIAIDHSYQRLRQVCRLFNDLLSSPSYFIMTDTVN
jgi:hypothetical protein